VDIVLGTGSAAMATAELCTTETTAKEEGATPDWQPALADGPSMLEELFGTLGTGGVVDTLLAQGDALHRQSEMQGKQVQRARRKSKDLEQEAFGTSQEQAAQLEKIFNQFDTQPKDGYIEAFELKTALIRAGKTDLTDETVAEIVTAMDMDGDGKISLEEFRMAFNKC